MNNKKTFSTLDQLYPRLEFLSHFYELKSIKLLTLINHVFPLKIPKCAGMYVKIETKVYKFNQKFYLIYYIV